MRYTAKCDTRNAFLVLRGLKNGMSGFGVKAGRRRMAGMLPELFRVVLFAPQLIFQLPANSGPDT
eukprot:1592987-Rhodomonas_salina.1